jgi:hypothetical protein
MARIRTIKPEFWTNEQVVECSPTARLLFVGMWNFSDDGGNHPASCKTLKMEIFPGDNISVTEIQGMISELIFNGLVIEYEVENKQYWHVTGWHHQKIDKVSKKYPPPEKGKILRTVVEQSSNGSRAVVEQTPADVDVDVESKGKEIKPTTTSRAQDQISKAFFENRPALEKLFPDIQLDIAIAKLINHHRDGPVLLDPYQTVIKWCQQEFKPVNTPRIGKEGGKPSLDVKTSSNPDYWSEGAVVT